MLSQGPFRFVLIAAATIGMSCALVESACAEQPPIVQPATAEGIEFFESKVRPLLLEHCGKCHTAKKAAEAGELVLDSPAGILGGGSRGAVFVSGKPDDSLLLKAVRYADTDLQMPPEGKLPPAAIAVLSRWIELERRCRPAAQVSPECSRRSTSRPGASSGRSSRCATAAAPVAQANWLRRPADAFLLARLESAGLRRANRPIAAR